VENPWKTHGFPYENCPTKQCPEASAGLQGAIVSAPALASAGHLLFSSRMATPVVTTGQKPWENPPWFSS